MKKTILSVFVLVFCLTFTNSLNAEDKDIGLRFTNGGMGGAEISFQQGLRKNNRLEFDLGMYTDNHLSLVGIYQWKWPLKALGPGFDWYAGGGLGLLFLQNPYISFGVMGQIGLEYNFTIPLQLSLDWRPTFFYNDYSSYLGSSGVSVRYRF
jgi:hypothetical protein